MRQGITASSDSRNLQCSMSCIGSINLFNMMRNCGREPMKKQQKIPMETNWNGAMIKQEILQKLCLDTVGRPTTRISNLTNPKLNIDTAVENLHIIMSKYPQPDATR